MKLIGLDFGSTTSSAIIAEADAARNANSGKTEFANLRILYRSEPVFTPFLENQQIDELRLRALLDSWLAQPGLGAEPIQAGGAIVTGLASQKKNAASIARLVQSRIGDAVVAVADDPGLESWVSFMGNASGLSRMSPETPFLNLDIGGGTTNLAWGINGEVLKSGSFWIGARHFRFEAGTYLLKDVTPYGQKVLDCLGIGKFAGAELEEAEIDAIVSFYIRTLEGLLQGRMPTVLTQLSFAPPLLAAGSSEPVLTFSGGVAELLYQYHRTGTLPSRTLYGDLGVDLARGIIASPVLSRNLKSHQPPQKGRATVYGLMLHNTHLSGATLYLPNPSALPLRDLPLLGRVRPDADALTLMGLIQRAAQGAGGTGLQLESAFRDLAEIKAFTRNFSEALRNARYPSDKPIVLFVPQNVGKTLGQYITEWGQSELNLLVIDEVAGREAHFAALGGYSRGFVPVSFYGSHA